MVHIKDVQVVIAKELELAKANQSIQANRHRRDLSFKVGDLIRLDPEFITLAQHPSSKLRPRYLGPFKVTAVVSPVSYRIQLPQDMLLAGVHPVFHVSRLLPWTTNDEVEFPNRLQSDQVLPPLKDYIKGPTVHEVASISDCKIADDPDSIARPKTPCIYFLVNWSSSTIAPSWEPLRNVRRLDALTSFLTSPAWMTFIATSAYKIFAQKYPQKLPKKVQFSDMDTLAVFSIYDIPCKTLSIISVPSKHSINEDIDSREGGSVRVRVLPTT